MSYDHPQYSGSSLDDWRGPHEHDQANSELNPAAGTSHPLDLYAGDNSDSGYMTNWGGNFQTQDEVSYHSDDEYRRYDIENHILNRLGSMIRILPIK